MNPDIPSRLERLAAIVSTSDLSFDAEHRVPLDHVIALGLASRNSEVTSNVLRLYLARSPEAWHAAKASVIAIVRRLDAKRRWGLSHRDIDKVATHALMLHINPVCSHCKGRGYVLIPGTPTLSHRPCDHCKGTGKRLPNKRLRQQISTTISSLEHIDSITEAAVGRYLR